MIHVPGSKTAARLCLVAATSALAACDSDPIVVDVSPIFECTIACGEPSASPSVWIEGQTRNRHGEPLIGRNAVVLISADSTFPGGLSWAAPVDSAHGGFARAMQVEALCELPLFGQIQLRDSTGEEVLERSPPTRLFAGGLPAGCPFSAASVVDGVPTDTVMSRDLYLDSR